MKSTIIVMDISTDKTSRFGRALAKDYLASQLVIPSHEDYLTKRDFTTRPFVDVLGQVAGS